MTTPLFIKLDVFKEVDISKKVDSEQPVYEILINTSNIVLVEKYIMPNELKRYYNNSDRICMIRLNCNIKFADKEVCFLYTKQSFLQVCKMLNTLQVVRPVKKPRTKPRKKPSHEEDDFQKALTLWLDLQANKHKFFWHSIPNGGARDAKTGALLKETGVKAGTPDLFIARACNGKNGCYVELKSAKGRLSPAQKVVINKLQNDGFEVLIVRNMDEAIKEISEYLNIHEQ